MKIIKPTFVVHKEVCLDNLKRLKKRAEVSGASLRPHFKTHQLAEVGEWFKAEGIDKCTVSSLDMAEYFYNHGWKDILIAFPFNYLEIETLRRIKKDAKITLCIESKEVAQHLINLVDFPLHIMIKIDAGYHRTGISADDFARIDSILELLEKNTLLTFTGFLQHAGHTYKVSGKEAIDVIHSESTKQMLRLKERYVDRHPNLIISSGDTPTASVSDYSQIDEMRAGNFIYYDVMQAEIGSCHYKNIGVTLACPVVAKHPDRNEIVIYGGAVHFSKDTIRDENEQNFYGYLAGFNNADTFQPHFTKSVYLNRLSQEHGIIKAPDDFIEIIQAGDILHFYPIHSCLTANLMLSNTKIL